MISTYFYDPIWCIWCFCVRFQWFQWVCPNLNALGPARFNNNSLPSFSAVCWCSKSSSIVICLSARRASGERSGIPPWSTYANRNKTRLPRASPNKRHSNSKTLQPTISKAAPETWFIKIYPVHTSSLEPCPLLENLLDCIAGVHSLYGLCTYRFLVIPLPVCWRQPPNMWRTSVSKLANLAGRGK